MHQEDAFYYILERNFSGSWKHESFYARPVYYDLKEATKDAENFSICFHADYRVVRIDKSIIETWNGYRNSGRG